MDLKKIPTKQLAILAAILAGTFGLVSAVVSAAASRFFQIVDPIFCGLFVIVIFIYLKRELVKLKD